ncbi:nucleotidyltransferase family protein [Metallibacterium scheffleri]
MQNAPDSQNAVVRAALLATVPDLHRVCRDPWIVIGSAAAYLAGAAVTVADLDVLTSVRDAQAMAGHWQAQRDLEYTPADSPRFRSHLARFHFGGLPVEVMGGLEVSGADGWVPVRIGASTRVDIGGLAVPIPTVAEQIRVLQSFARPKDFQRVALLKALPARAP